MIRFRHFYAGFLVAFLLLCSVPDLFALPGSTRGRRRNQNTDTERNKTFSTSPAGTAAARTPAGEPAAKTGDAAIKGTAAGERAEVFLPAFPETALAAFTITELPRAPRLIAGRGEVTADMLVSFLLNENRNARRSFVEELAGLYIAEAQAEGINHDVAFAQMCLETGFLRFGGLVKPEMNNFCGLGSIGPGEPGEWFASAELGVRAHIQHLKAYAADSPLNGELADPRFRLVRRGSAPAIQGLSGAWAADKRYAEKIEAILERLYRLKETAQQ